MQRMPLVTVNLCLVLAALLSLAVGNSQAGSANDLANSSGRPATGPSAITNRSALLDDWGGLRSALEEKGITWELSHTTFYTGFLQGGATDNDFEFSHRFDALIAVATSKLGLWDQGGFRFHLEAIYGETDTLGSRRTGGLWPPYIGQSLPLGAPDELVASSIYYTHQLRDSTSLMIGKINLVDLFARDPFFGGWGRDRFSYSPLVVPPTGVTPPTFMGLLLNHRVGALNVTFQAFDPNDRTTDYFPSDLFDDGVNLSLGVAWSGDFLGRPSTLGISGTYSTKERLDLQDFLLPPGLVAGTKDGSYAFTLSGSHVFWESPVHPGRGLGVYFRSTIADGNPNPFEFVLVGGISAYGLVPGRAHDVFGIGCSHYQFSSALRFAASPLIEIGSEQAVEGFYNFKLTPWLHLTANLMWIRPGPRTSSDSWMAGLRAVINF